MPKIFRDFSITLYLLWLGSSSVYAQNNPQVAARQLYEAIYNIDIDAILNLSGLDPSLECYHILDEVFQNEANKLRFSLTKATFEVGDSKEIGGLNWCPIRFRNTLRITYFSSLSGQEIAAIKAQLQEKFNTKQVNFEKQRQSFLIVYEALFIGKQKDNIWQVFVADSTLMTNLFESCLPVEVKKSLGI